MKTDKNIEQLLMSGKKLSLSMSEKATVKSALLKHASESLRYEGQSILSPWSLWLVRGSVSFASLLFVFLGTAYASQNSLPGEPLYAMKVHVVEEMVALTKMTSEDQVAYDTALLEKRFTELQQLLIKEETHQPESLTMIADQIDEHVIHATEILEMSEDEEFTHESKINASKKLSVLTKAQSKLSSQEKRLIGIADALEEIDIAASESLADTVEDFVSEGSSDDVSTYLSEQIAKASEQVQASTTNEVERDASQVHINDVNQALLDEDYSEAIISILEAQEVIDVYDQLRESVYSE